ncbi:hypothetical protein C0993_001163 [Termitomyces sp. T159_Od127]|nr:hypothetical protein C0993_001163 [Termitomyces sp. T159_Od127]
MSETVIPALTQDDIAESESVLGSADSAHGVASSHDNDEAVGTDFPALDIVDLETSNAVVEPIYDNPNTVAPAVDSKEAPIERKPSSIRAGGPPSPQVKKVVFNILPRCEINGLMQLQTHNSGTLSTGAVGKVPPAKSTVTTKSARPSVAPALSRSTSSSAAVPAKTSMTTTARVPAAPAAVPSRRLSVATAKPTAQPMSKPTLSASSAIGKPTSGSANSKSTTGTKHATTATSTKPAPSTSFTRPSVVSPAGSVTSTSTRPKSAVSDGVKRPAGAPTSRQSLPAGIKLPLSSSGKLPLSRSSTSAAATKPYRVGTSIPSIREGKEDNKVSEDLRAQLQELNESLLAKSESVNRLEGRIGELTSALENVQADLVSKSSAVEQLIQDKSSLEKQLSETKDAVEYLESVRQDNESTIASLHQEIEAAKKESLTREEIIEGLRTEVQGLMAQAKSTQYDLDNLKNATSSDAEKAVHEHQAFLKTSTELAAAVAELDAFKKVHAATIHELESKVEAFEATSASFDELSLQLARLKAEKEENSGKLSELEIEILELQETQETSEEERERLSAQVKTLEEEVDKATAATRQAYETAKAKEDEVAQEVAKLKEAHDTLLKVEIEKQGILTDSIEALKADLAAAHTAQEQIKVDALLSIEEHNRKLAEVEAESTKRHYDLSEEITRVTKELENQEGYYHAKVTAIKEEHNQLLQEVFERAKAEAGDLHAQELQALRASSTTSIEQLQAANQSALEDIKAEHTNLLESEVGRFEKIITALKLDLKATQDDLLKAKTSLELARAEVEDLTQQRDAAHASASSISNSAVQSEEVIRLSRELSMAKDDLATANEMLNLTKISLAELSDNQVKDLEEAAKGRAEEVTRLRAAHNEEVSALSAQKSELAIKVSDLEGELVTLRASIDSERATIKANGHGAVPQVSTGVTKEELQKLHEAHNLKLYDLAAEHDKVVKALKDELEAAHNKTEELNAEVQRKVMEIQYLEQDQEENQDQITRYVRFFRFKSFVITGLILGFLYLF